MKTTINLQRFILFFLLFFVANTKGNINVSIEPSNPIVVDFLDLSLTHVEFTNEADASLVIVKTNLDWKATEDADWIDLTAYSGTKSKGFLILATDNDIFKREAMITIKAGDKTKEILVKQRGTERITYTVDDVSFDMVLIAGGTFTMGGGGDSNADYYGISHQVLLHDFYISETEVTNALWMAVSGTLPYNKNREVDKPLLPVSEISWQEVVNDFIPKLNTETGVTFRLPTEAEWEYAAMGGQKSNGYKYAGSNSPDDVAWYDANASNMKKNIKEKSPNELGLFDMSGNVEEWCSDWYDNLYGVTYEKLTTETHTNPKGPETGEKKIVRGGSWTTMSMFGGPAACEVKFRSSYESQKSTSWTGFRLVITD